ncbi:MAG: glucose-6-phosphate isomerase [Candidatus Omnitrophica bacterium]|nr:glucose-6-phosphate isomerase [Candidatus Omnitrophota bacterium]
MRKDRIKNLLFLTEVLMTGLSLNNLLYQQWMYPEFSLRRIKETEIDFSKEIGLPVSKKGDLLKWDESTVYVDPSSNPSTRTLEAIREVLYSPDIADEYPHRILYYMYRDVHKIVDESLIRKDGLRYDITVIPPGKIGREYTKTAGHYHPKISGTNYTYPEVYQVIKGEALYLLQHLNNKGEVDDVVVVKAKEGETVIIPPGYGHVTINAGRETLIMNNWVSNKFQSIYEPYKEKKGAAYYALVEGVNGIRWVVNTNYPEYKYFQHKIRFIDAADLLKKFILGGIQGIGPAYIFGVGNLDALIFLNEPWRLFEEDELIQGGVS